MYLPYFRGKQYEIAAIRDLIPVLRRGHVVPIIEPVRARGTKKNPAGLASIEELAGTGAEMILIANPQNGALRTKHTVLAGFLSGLLSPNLHAGYIVNPKTALKDVKEFLDRQTVRQVAIVHWGGFSQSDALASLLKSSSKVAYQIFVDGRNSTRYVHTFSGVGRSIILSDGFQRQQRNDEYPESSFFSDVHRTYGARGYDGFGDFLIVGEQYRETGGRPFAVTLHLTNREKSDEIWTHHFVSDDSEGQGVDTEGRFFQALTKLVRFAKSADNSMVTEGCKEYFELFEKKHYPTLGPPKKISMKHHVEIINALLASRRRRKGAT